MYKGNNVFIQKLLIFINMIILPVLIVLAWHFATSTGAMSTLILPKISTVLETLKEQIANGTLPGDIGISLSRIAKRLCTGSRCRNFAWRAHGNEQICKPFLHADIYRDPSDSNDRMGSDPDHLVWYR